MNEVQRQTSRMIAAASPPEAVDSQGMSMPTSPRSEAMRPPCELNEVHAEIPDRNFHGEERGADDDPEAARPRRPEIDQPGGKKAEHHLDRDRYGHIDRGDHDGVPEAVGGEHVEIVVEPDIAGDALPHYIVGETVLDDGDERQEGECNHPDDRRQEQDVFEDRPVFGPPRARRRHVPCPVRSCGRPARALPARAASRGYSNEAL